MSELAFAIARARAERAGSYLATPQAVAEEKARHEREVTELRLQWASERQVYEERLQSLANELATQRSMVEQLTKKHVDVLGLKRPPPKFLMIRDIVCEHYGVPVMDFMSMRQKQKPAHARQVSYWLARALTTLSTTQVGRICGGRDHSTIVYGLNKIDSLMASNDEFAAEILMLKQRVEVAIDNANIAAPGTTEREQNTQGELGES